MILYAALVCFIITLIVIPFIIRLSKALKIHQTILSYVDNHAQKDGTPTMGGLAFVFSIIITCIFFNENFDTETYFCLFVMFAYCVIGFLDDFIKVFFKQNKGLSVNQKLFSQIFISLSVSLYAYFNPNIGTNILIPFTHSEVDLGFFIIPFNLFLILATTNSVNLIDGLDGLATSVTAVYIVFFGAILGILSINNFSINNVIFFYNDNLFIICAAIFGALLAFLLFNGYPAKIFMGDTGSLALGGIIATLGIVSKLSFYIAIIGIMYVISSISVLMQVGYFKLTKKRIFLMAPFHHHLERKGIHENRIVLIYCAITFFVGLISLILIKI